MMMCTYTRQAHQRNQRKERPDGNPTTAHRRNLAAIANRAVDGILLKYLNVGLRLLCGNLNT